MKSDIKIKIKEDNCKALKIYILIMSLSLLFGMICGIIIVFLNSHISNTLSMLTNNLIYIAPYVSITIVAIASIITFRMYRNAKRLYMSWQEDDESTMYQIDLKLSYAFSITSIVMIIVYFFFGVSFLALGDINQDRIWIFINLIIALIGLICAMIYITIAQKKIVDFQREMKPEKNGSIFDIKFSQKWEESCDEAEKSVIYKSAYHSFRAVQGCCIILWIISVFGIIMGIFGIAPILMVTIIWLVQTKSYNNKTINFFKSTK